MFRISKKDFPGSPTTKKYLTSEKWLSIIKMVTMDKYIDA